MQRGCLSVENANGSLLEASLINTMNWMQRGMWAHRSTLVQSFSIPVASFTMHPCIVTRHHCTDRKADSAIFCTKKQGYLRVCQATKRVDSIGERLYRRRRPPPKGGVCDCRCQAHCAYTAFVLDSRRVPTSRPGCFRERAFHPIRSANPIVVFPILADPDKNNLQSAQLLIGRVVLSGRVNGCRASVLHSCSCRDRPKLGRLQYNLHILREH